MFPWPLFLIVILAALVFDAVGFKKFVWFMSVGYGLAVAAISLALMVTSFVYGIFNIPVIVLCLVMLVYGIRLGLFLLIRELKSAQYKEKVKGVMMEDKKIPLFVTIPMWFLNVLLFYMQTSAATYRLNNLILGNVKGVTFYIGKIDISIFVGIVIGIIGLVLEALADSQKSAQKKENPKMAATKGLYKMCRCPNYFGEILVWTGVFVSGIGVYRGLQWLIAAFGYVCIVYIMFNGAKRLEKRQNKNYGAIPEYQEYVSKTPIIIPLVPLYHLYDEKKEAAKANVKAEEKKESSNNE